MKNTFREERILSVRTLKFSHSLRPVAEFFPKRVEYHRIAALHLLKLVSGTVASLATIGSFAYAEEIIFTGNGSELTSDPAADNSGAQSLLPSVTSPSNNNVTVNSGVSGSSYAIPSRVYGGYSADGAVMDNVVSVNGGTMGPVFGGYSARGIVSGNKVEISGGTIQYGANAGVAYRQVYGGYSLSGDVVGNNVTVSGGTFLPVNTSSTASIVGGGSRDGKVSGNSIDFSKGTISGSLSGGESSTNDAVENRVTVTGGYVAFVYGGSSSSKQATGNTVNIDGGSVRFVFGGITPGSGLVSENTVNVTAGTVSRTIYGGQSSGGVSSSNKVNIYGGTINADVIGGSTSSGQAVNNTVALFGEKMSIIGSLYGGYDYNANAVEIFSGNTLNLNEYRGSVKGIYNFENYNWILPKNVVSGDTLIKITGNDSVNLTGTTQTVAMTNDGNVLNVGDSITLIDKAHGFGSKDITVSQGFFLNYNMEVSDSSNALVLTVKQQTEVDPNPPKPDPDPEPSPGPDPKPEPTPDPEPGIPPVKPVDPIELNPSSNAFSAGRAASLAFLTQGSDLIAIHGGNAARAALAAADADVSHYGFVPFIVTSGGSSRYKTGSHIDVKGVNTALGIASGLSFGAGHQLTLAAFYEFGRGNYDSYNAIETGSIYGDGNVNYSGGGLLFRLDFSGTGLGRVSKLRSDVNDGLYAEGSIRTGETTMDFDSSDLVDGEGYRGRYDSKVRYYGAHAVAGYVFNFNDYQSLDVYTRYMWTKMESDTVSIGKDRLRFDSSASSKIRVGARYSHRINEQIKPYIGAAYEHEFKGEVSARAYSFELDKPSLKGDTAVLELGVSFTPVKGKPFNIDVAGEGYAGQRQGGGGSVKLKYQF
ncbi:hypothetical protein [Bartonella sp. LJL80]